MFDRNMEQLVLVVSLIYNSLYPWKRSFRFVGIRGGGGVMKVTVKIQKLCKKWPRLYLVCKESLLLNIGGGFHMLVEGIALENVEFSSNQEKSYDV